MGAAAAGVFTEAQRGVYEAVLASNVAVLESLCAERLEKREAEPPRRIEHGGARGRAWICLLLERGPLADFVERAPRGLCF